MRREGMVLLLCLSFLLLPGCGGKADPEADGEASPDQIAADGQPGEGDQPEKEEKPAALTVSETVDFLMSLPPQTLGLPGTRMSEYLVYPAMEVVSVDGLTCSKLSVYRINEETGTNEVQGIYLLSRGAERRLFRLEEDGEEVTELALPQPVAPSSPEEAPAPASEQEKGGSQPGKLIHEKRE